MGDQRFMFWFTDWPSTHVNAGQTVEVVLRAEYERLREALEDAIGWIEPSMGGRAAAERARKALRGTTDA